MSYFGTVAHMINSLKYNNSLLKRPKAYSKLKEFLLREVEYRTKLKIIEIDPNELSKIKKEIRHNLKEEKRRNNYILSFTVLVIFLLLSFIIYLILFTASFEPYAKQNVTLEEKISKEKKANAQFNFYINDGYKWLEKNNFKNAQFQFDLAVQTRPDDIRANIGLMKTLLKKCHLIKDCERVDEQISITLKNFSDIANIEDTISAYLFTLGVVLEKKDL